MNFTEKEGKDFLWSKGIIIWKLHQKQLEANKIITDMKDSWLSVIMCSRQFGKTYMMCTLALQEALSKPNNHVKYGADMYENLKKYVYPTIDKIIEDCPDAYKPEVIRSEHLVRCKNGSTIEFVGLDRNPDGIRGIGVTRIFIDEGGYTDKLYYIYYDVIVPMFTHMQQHFPKCIMAGTPSDSPNHDFIKIFKPKAEAEGTFIKFTIDDNPLISQEEKDRLIQEYYKNIVSEKQLAIQHQKMRKELYCEVTINKERAIIPEVNPPVHFKKIEKPKHFEELDKYVSMDLGIKHKTVALFAFYQPENQSLYITNEYVAHGERLTTKDLHSDLKKTEAQAFLGCPPFRRIADNNNPLLLQDLMITYGMLFHKVNKSAAGVSKRLQHMVDLTRRVFAEKRIFIDPSCKELTGALENCLWDKNFEKFEEDDTYGHADAIAALIYLVKSVDFKRNPLYKEKDLSYYYPNRPKPTDGVKKLYV